MTHHLQQSASGFLLRLVVIASACLLLRLSVAVAIDLTIPVVKHVDVYSSIAANLADGHGFVAQPGGEIIMWRAPLYPALLSILYRIFGEIDNWAILIVHALLDALTAVLIWRIGSQLFSEPIGIFAALVYAIHPLSAYYTLRFMPEPFFALILTVLAAALVWTFSQQRPWRFLLVGILGAVATLVKPVALGLVPLLALLLGLRILPSRGQTIAAVGYLMLGFVIALAPWTLRNYSLTGAIIPSATGGGYALWLGNHVPTNGLEDWELPPPDYRRLVAHRAAILAQSRGNAAHYPPIVVTGDGRDRSFTEPVNISVAEDRAFARAAVQELMAHPFDTLRLLIKKFFRFWFNIFLPQNRWAQTAIAIGQTVFLSCAMYGIGLAWQRAPAARIVLIPVLYLALAHTVTFATLRYSIPVVPLVTLFATFGLCGCITWLLGKFGIWPRAVQALGKCAPL